MASFQLPAPDFHRYEFLQTGTMELVRANDADLDDEELGGMDKSHKKLSHCVVEKRRRDKMNVYITELSSLVPHCEMRAKKQDKLTILRQTLDYVKAVKAKGSAVRQSSKPYYIPERTHHNILAKSVRGFLLVVGCNHDGRILFTSDSVVPTIGQSPEDLFGKSIFDLVHPRDMETLKRHLTPPDQIINTRYQDTGIKIEPSLSLQPYLLVGDRRSFKIRLRKGRHHPSSSCRGSYSRESHENADYCVVQFTGYNKAWPHIRIPGTMPSLSDDDLESFRLNCLVAVVTPVTKDTTSVGEGKMSREVLDDNRQAFVSRHASDGTFTSVDERITPLLGFLPGEVRGSSPYDYYHREDVQVMKQLHKEVMKQDATIFSPSYRFKLRASPGHYATLKTEYRAFTNPSTQTPQFMIAVNNVIAPNDYDNVEVSSSGLDDDDVTPNTSTGQTRRMGAVTNSDRLAFQQATRRESPGEGMPDSSSLITTPVVLRSSHEVVTSQYDDVRPSTSWGREAMTSQRDTTVMDAAAVESSQNADVLRDLADLVNETGDIQAALYADDDFSSLLHNLMGESGFTDADWPSGL